MKTSRRINFYRVIGCAAFVLSPAYTSDLIRETSILNQTDTSVSYIDPQAVTPPSTPRSNNSETAESRKSSTKSNSSCECCDDEVENH